MVGFANVVSAVGNEVATFGKDVLKTGMGFDKTMGQTYAVSGAYDDLSQSLLRAAALQEAANSIFTASDVGMAEYYEGLAGYNPEAIAAGLHGIVIAAEAAGEDLKPVADILTDTTTAFGDSAADMTRYSDVFAATATNSNTTIMQMGAAMQYVGPVAGSLHYSLEDVATSMGLIADAGIKGSKAGTSLRNIMNRIAVNAGANTKRGIEGARDIVEGMGVAFFDAYGKARPWNDFLVDMRAAWRNLDPANAELVASAFGSIGNDAESAEQTMVDFGNDLQNWRTEWNKLGSDAERQAFAKTLALQFEALGVSMYDSSGKLRNFGDVAHETEIKLGGLTDQERQYAGKQIGSLRGISAWLRLMEATDDEYNELYESITNSTGAADKMRDVMYDNLYGDVTRLNAAFDVLKIAIYDDVNGPLRELAQYGTGALQRITTVINEQGLAGGIRQLGFEITGFSKKLAPVLESLGAALAPLVTSLIKNVAPALKDSAITLGKSLAAGMAEGFGDTPIGRLFGFSGGDHSVGSLTSMSLATPEPTGAVTMEVGGIEVSAADIQAAIDAAQPSANGYMVTIGDIEMSIDNAENLKQELGGTIGSEAGSEIATEIGSEVSSVDSSGLSTALGTAGPTAGAAIASDIQSSLSATSFIINVAANVLGLPSGGGGGGDQTEHHAKSMYGGTILRGATLFGINDKGQPMVGGETGPEAIVGVNSLHSMIQSSVSNAMMAMADRLEGAFAAQPATDLQVVLDTGALVGGITNKMNRALGATAARRSTGRV